MELYSVIKELPVLPPQVATDDTALVGAIIDRSGFGSLTLSVQTGTLADAAATFAIVLEHGDTADLSDAEDVPSSERLGASAFNQANDGQCLLLAYIGAKRYVRLSIEPSGNAANAPIAAHAILGHPRQAPV